MEPADLGLVGLGPMGGNLALNLAERGFRVALFNRTAEKTRAFAAGPGAHQALRPCFTAGELLGALQRPRRLLLLVRAGGAVDETIAALRPGLERGDIVIDGGNSFFRDTERRARELAAAGVRCLGVGVSGGEEGARHGPCLMVGGAPDAYAEVERIFTGLAARVDGPCCGWLGPGGAGHYAKMVHNGIEYGLVQLIAEAYDLLQQALAPPAARLAAIFGEWQGGEEGGYLLELAACCLARLDPETGRPLVELIQDQAGQRGTGKWATQVALDLGVPTPALHAAVAARNLSALKEERVRAQRRLRGPRAFFKGDEAKLCENLRQAFRGAQICVFAQGLALLRAAGAAEAGYRFELAEVARVWRGGCIIRGRLLEAIQQAFRQQPDLPNLLFAPELARRLGQCQKGWRETLRLGVRLGVALPVLHAALGYYDAYRRARGPANLIQALRDAFGARTYRRIDREGICHTAWRE